MPLVGVCYISHLKKSGNAHVSNIDGQESCSEVKDKSKTLEHERYTRWGKLVICITLCLSTATIKSSNVKPSKNGTCSFMIE